MALFVGFAIGFGLLLVFLILFDALFVLNLGLRFMVDLV